MAELLQKTQRVYLSPVTATGMLHQKCEPDSPKAIMREVKDENGNLVARFELRHSAIKGVVEDVSFVEGKYGEQVQLTFASSGKSIEGDFVVSMGIKSPFGRSFLQKIPNIDFSKEMILRPYAFDDNGKRRVGVAILQDGEKVENHYYDTIKDEYKNGYPKMEKPYLDMSEDELDIYFAQVRKFLTTEAKKKLKLPQKKMSSWSDEPVEYPTEEINPDDIPF